MPLFFRLETNEGRGVYTCERDDVSEVLSDWLGHDDTGDRARHPTPHDDSALVVSARAQDVTPGELKWNGQWRFGFISIAQLRAWFYNDNVLRQLGEVGIQLSVYAPDIILAGSTQACMSGEHQAEAGPLETYELRWLVKNSFNIPIKELTMAAGLVD